MGPTLSTHVATLHADMTRSLQAKGLSAAQIATIIGTAPGYKSIPTVVANATAALTVATDPGSTAAKQLMTPALSDATVASFARVTASPAATKKEKDSIQKALGH